jgi:DHA1 family bicyclomycin/chloramphenicol resistance-like MFS transporter
MAPSLLRSALILGLLSAVGPFSIDMYLPAMPAIGESLGAPVASVQGTITAFFLAFGVSQLFYGPWADMAGRKPPLVFGLCLFAAASVACALAPDIGWLTAARFVQGLGAAVVMVIPRAVIRDLHTGHEATRLMAMIMLVISVSPMLAPLAGSLTILVFGWRAIFWLLVVGTGASLLVTLLLQPETLPPERRVPVDPRALARGAVRLLGDPVFMGLTFVGGFGMASFFVFMSSASFVYTSQYGLSPTQFSLAFAANAIGFFGASQLAAGLGQRYGAARVVFRAIWGFFAATGILAVLALTTEIGLFTLIGLLLLGNACLGLVIPTTMVMALDAHGDAAGLASSLGGTLQMLAGGATIALTAPFFDATVRPMAVAIFVCAAGALVLTLLLARRIART